MKLLVASRNPGKVREIFTILQDLPLELVSLYDLDPEKSWHFEEKWSSFQENAFYKAQHFAQESSLFTLADDSGISVDALQGEMGVRTRRWGKGESASDEEWIAYFLERMQDFPHDRGARFMCCAAVAIGPRTEIFVAEVRGEITHTLEAPIIPGLPLSSCFRPDGYDRVYSALTPEEKAAISHRGLAVSKAKEFLQGMIS